jgi:peptidoglycan/xylan/chitin deacetylase (PgdA/CDA1 family)
MSVKKKLASIVGATFLPEMINKMYKGTKIVFYHGVIEDPVKNAIVQANQMSFRDFKKQIEYLDKNFEIISIDEFKYRFENRVLKGREVVITFDDGYKNNLTVVAPYLNKKNLPYTIYVCPELSERNLRVPTYYVRSSIYSGRLKEINIPVLRKVYNVETEESKNIANKELIDVIKTSRRELVNEIIEDIKSNFSYEGLVEMNNDFESEELLTVDEIKQLAAFPNCTIASHCDDHSILHQQQSKETIKNQLIVSRDKIINWVGKCDYFAFPNGNKDSVCDYSIEQAAMVYKMGFAVNGKNVSYNDNFGYISRFSLAPDFYAFKVQVLILSNL